jgi:hypothetical protein
MIVAGMSVSLDLPRVGPVHIIVFRPFVTRFGDLALMRARRS